MKLQILDDRKQSIFSFLFGVSNKKPSVVDFVTFHFKVTCFVVTVQPDNWRKPWCTKYCSSFILCLFCYCVFVFGSVAFELLRSFPIPTICIRSRPRGKIELKLVTVTMGS